MKRPFRIASLAILGAVLFATGCTAAPSEPTTSATGGGDLSMVVATEPRSLTSAIDNNAGASAIAALVVDNLVATKPDGNPAPGLAKSWKRVDGDSTAWTFELRDDVVFSNGEKFDADTAVASILGMRDGKGARASYLAPIANAEATGKYELKVTTKNPIGFAPEILSLVEVKPLKASATMTTEEWGRAPIGTGPFVLDEWKPGQDMRFSKNPHYWGTPPNIKTLTITWNTEPDSRVAMLESGQVQIAKDIPSMLIDGVEKSGTAKVKGTQDPGVWVLQPNMHVAPFNDINVRKALAYAIDRDKLVKGVFGGRGATAWANFFPASLAASTDYPGMITYDPKKAKSLLAAAGKVAPVEFYWNTENNQTGQAVSAMMEEVGFTVHQHPMERGAFFEMLLKDDMPGMHIISVRAAYPHQSYSINSFILPTSVVTYCADDQLVGAANAAMDLTGKARTEAYGAIEKTILVDRVCPIPMYTTQNTWGISNSIQGWEPRADGLMDFSKTVVK